MVRLPGYGEFADGRSIRIIDLKTRIGLLHRLELSLQDRISRSQTEDKMVEVRAELDRILNEIASLNEELKKVESEP